MEGIDHMLGWLWSVCVRLNETFLLIPTPPHCFAPLCCGLRNSGTRQTKMKIINWNFFKEFRLIESRKSSGGRYLLYRRIDEKEAAADVAAESILKSPASASRTLN